MKKGKIWIVVLIGLLLVGGMVLTGCGEKCSNNNKCKKDSTDLSMCSTSGCNVSNTSAIGTTCNCQ
jgi:hypothetical protein